MPGFAARRQGVGRKKSGPLLADADQSGELFGIGAQWRGLAVIDDAALVEHHAALGELERDAEKLAALIGVSE